MNLLFRFEFNVNQRIISNIYFAQILPCKHFLTSIIRGSIPEMSFLQYNFEALYCDTLSQPSHTDNNVSESACSREIITARSLTRGMVEQ